MKRFVACPQGATAVEFAIVSPILILCILFILIVGLILYLNQALDYATSKAARQVVIGTVQKSGMSQSAFQTQLCSYLPAAFTCSNVIVNLQTTTEASQPGGYYAFVNSNQTALITPTSSTQFSPGLQGSYEYLQVIYPVSFFPSGLARFFGTATYQGNSVYLIVSTAAFRNEQY